ncbi:30S ribosomal protein S2 [Mycoplasmoides pirum]|uniref:30S ribosomal protein S2 n=1 Tax=Mycoplasmoides pirum TaxID=2122 RepID=UPI00069916B8|nr:30S ribosomal protein S2 [Mycoplasmoides pirum]
MFKNIDNSESANDFDAAKIDDSNIEMLEESSINSETTDSQINELLEKPIVTTSKIMEVGGHIGFSKRRWNPKMKPYIYTKRGVNFNSPYDVLNLPLVHERLKEAFDYLVEVSKNNGTILFVGTKTKQVQELVRDIAKRVPNINYIYQRWLGGTLTNFKTINNSIKQLNKLTERSQTGLGEYTKKEQILIMKKLNKLEKFFGGIKNMRGLPSVIVVDDPVHEKNAIFEARKLNIPIVAISNTNANPDLIDYIVPANNTSIRSITLFMNLLADAVAIGQNQKPLFAFKTDEEIVIAQPQRRDRFENRNIVNRQYNYKEIQNKRRELNTSQSNQKDASTNNN